MRGGTEEILLAIGAPFVVFVVLMRSIAFWLEEILLRTVFVWKTFYL